MPGRRAFTPADGLLVAQGVATAAIAWPGPARWRLSRPVTVLAVLTGAAGTALLAEGMRFLGRDITPFVEPRGQARLQTAGPYEISRHPVYAGLLVSAAAVAVLRRRPEPLLAAGVLAVVLHLKAGVEERRLSERFGLAYEEYALRTPRLAGLPRPASPAAAVRAAFGGHTEAAGE